MLVSSVFFLTPLLSFLLFVSFLFGAAEFSFLHHSLLFKPKQHSDAGPVMAECHYPPRLTTEPVNGDFDPWPPFFWHAVCLARVWTLPLSWVNESRDKWEWSWLPLLVCEDLAIILHAWCLYLASLSPSLSPYLCFCLCLRMLISQQIQGSVCTHS